MVKISFNKIVISTFLICLICFGWSMALTSNLRMRIKQDKLLNKAIEYEKNEIYQNTVECLLQATKFETPQSEQIYKYLAKVYKKMGYDREYADTLNTVIIRNTQDPEIYNELAIYFYENYKYQEALTILKKGISILNNDKLKDFYEQIRYKTYSLFCYLDSVGYFNNGIAPVLKNGLWGYIDTKGNVKIDFKYDKATNFSNGQALVINKGKTAIINTKGFNTVVAKFAAKDIKGLSEGYGAVKLADKWFLINNNFDITEESFNDVGSNLNNLVAIKKENKWGVRYRGGDIIIDCIYDEIVLSEQGFCFVNDTNFVKIDKKYQLINTDGALTCNRNWDNAKGFCNSVEYAAVELDEKWGYINSQGEDVLPYIWDDARSFSYGVAAVKINDKWGYINSRGNIVIDAVYDEALSFSEGLAAVRIGDTWRFIGLEEYRPKNSLLLESLGG